jgi:prevent-host-death family protein
VYSLATVGSRELQTQASEILRRVRVERTVFEVTLRGRAVARIVPVAEPTENQSLEAFLERLEQTAEDNSSRGPANVSAVKGVRQISPTKLPYRASGGVKPQA